MQLSQARIDELDDVMEIVHDAQQLLAADGVNQWQDGYPNTQILRNDIEHDHLFVYRLDGKPVAMAAILPGPDPDYANITNGTWDYPHANYTVIHRVAVAKSVRGKHIAGLFYDACIDYAFAQGCSEIRVDTHPDNMRMQALITSRGFIRQGLISVRDDSSNIRIAYALRH